MTHTPFTRIPDGAPNPYTEGQLIDVQYADGRFNFKLPAKFHGAGNWEHTGGNFRSFIIAHREAAGMADLDGAYTPEELA